MRWSAVMTLVVMTGLVCLSGSRGTDRCAVTLRLVDAETGGELAGLVRFSDAEGNAVEPRGLLSRGLGLDEQLPIRRWWVVAGKTVVDLPRTALTIDAIQGLETELAQVPVDFSTEAAARVDVPLRRFYAAAAQGYRAGNTHLHLQKITRDECDRYLSEVPQADGLDVLFLSYLERAVADREYTSNHYTDGDLEKLTRMSGVVFGNGEEHRHNFTGFGEGYGHVMLLNIKRLIQPVSIGPGIMQQGTDGIPLQRGLDAARRDGATTLWCHNNWGLESAPNFFSGRMDAQNIFDGGTHGSYKDSFYRYLNAGLKVPFSTGTDWFLYDFSRAYVELAGEPTVANWLKGLAAGRSYITNGPLLEFEVDGRRPGGTLALESTPEAVRLKATAVGRSDFGRIEVVLNGKVAATAESRPSDGHFRATLDQPLSIPGPCWLCLRTPPPAVKDDPELTAEVGRNLLGRDLFAHTSAVYVTVGGRSYFDAQVVRELLKEMQADSETIAHQARFADAQERERVLDVYRDGMAEVRKRLE